MNANPRIDLKLYASLTPFSPETTDGVAIAPGTTVAVLMERLGIPAGEVSLIFINGRLSDPTTPLQGGERVGLFPPVGGG